MDPMSVSKALYGTTERYLQCTRFPSCHAKQWSFSGSEGQLTDTGSQGRTFLSQKTSGSFEAVKNAADTESAGGYNVILILVCVSASLRFRFLT